MKLKLTKKEKDLLWGDPGPYSEAKIVVNMRIMDDGVSRVMIEVEGNINPTTFRMVEANKEHFKNDPDVLALLETAEYQDERDGYLVAIGEPAELTEAKDGTFKAAAKKQQYLKDTIFKMHRFVMQQLGLPFSDNLDDEGWVKKSGDTPKDGIPSRYF
ncbi:MAG: hypothetical protein WC878_05880 [Candidatus Paceibacterota bacterium]|jgi:hypothetical protein